MYTIYQFIFPNQKQYIGLTSREPEIRWANGKGYDSQVVGKAINKYGWQNITKNILAENLTLEEADVLEKFYIKKFKTLIDQNGYNIETGGFHGEHYNWDKNLVFRLWNKFLGVIEISKTTGYPVMKVSEILEEFGISKEQRKQRRQDIVSIQSKSVAVFDSFGELQDICESVSVAAKIYNLPSSCILSNCNNKTKATHGLRFRYNQTWIKNIEPLIEPEKIFKRTKKYFKKELGVDLSKLWALK